MRVGQCLAHVPWGRCHAGVARNFLTSGFLDFPFLADSGGEEQGDGYRLDEGLYYLLLAW